MRRFNCISLHFSAPFPWKIPVLESFHSLIGKVPYYRKFPFLSSFLIFHFSFLISHFSFLESFYFSFLVSFYFSFLESFYFSKFLFFISVSIFRTSELKSGNERTNGKRSLRTSRRTNMRENGPHIWAEMKKEAFLVQPGNPAKRRKSPPMKFPTQPWKRNGKIMCFALENEKAWRWSNEAQELFGFSANWIKAHQSPWH